MVENLQGGLGTLPDSLVGSSQKSMKLQDADIAHDNPSTDTLMESWASRNGGEKCLLPNNEYLHGVPVPQNSGMEMENKAEIIRKARLMNMGNEPVTKVDQFLSEFIQKGVLSSEDCLKIFRERPLHGQIFFDRNVGTCNDLRLASKNPQSKYAVWVVMADECKVCKQTHGFCPETGRRLVERQRSPETSGELLKETCKELLSRGRIMAEVNSWEDLKRILLAQEKEMSQRSCTHAALISETSAPDITAHEKTKVLADAALRWKNDSDKVSQVVYAREVTPVARHIAELMLRKTDPAVLRREIERIYPDNDLVVAALAFIKDKTDPLLLTTRTAAFPILYDTCELCRNFLHKQDIRVAYVHPIPKCSACHWRDNPQRLCSLIGASVLDHAIAMDVVDSAINELRADGLTASQVRDLKAIANPRERLDKAVRMSMADSNKKKDSISASRQNSLVLSTASFAGRENAVQWCRENLSNGARISQVKEMVARTRNDPNRIVEDALLGMETIHASSIDRCMSDKYVFKPGAVICKAEKCESCRNSDAIGCKKYGLIFSGASVAHQNTGETAEAEEIRNFFADSALVADVDPDSSRKIINIKFENEGAEMRVDLGPSGAITNYQQLYDFFPKDIDIGSKKAGLSPLDVQDLGQAMDISSIL